MVLEGLSLDSYTAGNIERIVSIREAADPRTGIGKDKKTKTASVDVRALVEDRDRMARCKNEMLGHQMLLVNEIDALSSQLQSKARAVEILQGQLAEKEAVMKGRETLHARELERSAALVGCYRQDLEAMHQEVTKLRDERKTLQTRTAELESTLSQNRSLYASAQEKYVALFERCKTDAKTTRTLTAQKEEFEAGQRRAETEAKRLEEGQIVMQAENKKLTNMVRGLLAEAAAGRARTRLEHMRSKHLEDRLEQTTSQRNYYRSRNDSLMAQVTRLLNGRPLKEINGLRHQIGEIQQTYRASLDAARAKITELSVPPPPSRLDQSSIERGPEPAAYTDPPTIGATTRITSSISNFVGDFVKNIKANTPGSTREADLQITVADLMEMLKEKDEVIANQKVAAKMLMQKVVGLEKRLEATRRNSCKMVITGA